MIPEIISKESLEEFSKKLKGWKDNDTNSVTNLVKRLQTAKVPYEFATHLDSIVGHVFKEMISNNVEKNLLTEMNRLKKKLKEIDKIPQIVSKEVATIETKNDIPQELIQKYQGRHKEYLKYLYKAFMKNMKNQCQISKVVEFIQELEADIYSLFEGDDAKILDRLKEIKFNMEAPGSIEAKKLMISGAISVREVSENKAKTYASGKERKSSDSDRAPVPKFKPGEGEQCQKCSEKEAYCTRMVQIRSSDEPMTRFMRCRKCEHQWTDN